MTNQIEQPKSEVPRSEADPTGQKQPTEPGQLLGPAVQQRVAQAIEPVLGDVQRRMAEIVQQHMKLELQRVTLSGSEHEAQLPGEQPTNQESERRLPENVGPPISFTVTVGRPQAEQALRSTLDSALDVLFSDTLRAAVEQQAKKTVRSLITGSRKALSEEDARNTTQQRVDQELDRMVDDLFSASIRRETRQDGEQVVRELVRGDLSSARREGERALQSFVDRWGNVGREHWEKVFQVLLKAVVDGAMAKAADDKRRSAARSSRQGSDEREMPQTILRSDKRAQNIWKKAHDRVAKRDGAGRGADRAGYQALKQEYEKKGDRWVKKGTERQSAVRSS